LFEVALKSDVFVFVFERFKRIQHVSTTHSNVKCIRFFKRNSFFKISAIGVESNSESTWSRNNNAMTQVPTNKALDVDVS
jgi:hypothetical protein